MLLSVNSSAEEFIVTVWGPAASLWICVVIMALLADHGHHHFVITISAVPDQAPWDSAHVGEDTVLLALLLCQFLAHLSWGAAHCCCSQTEPDYDAEHKSFKNKVLLFCLWRNLQLYPPRDIQNLNFPEQTMGDKRNIMFIQAKTVRKHASYEIWWY